LAIEIIIFVCTIIGTIVGILAYKSSTRDVLKETRTFAKEKLEFLEKINSDLIDDLKSYGKKNHSFESVFMQGLTLNQCIEILNKVKVEVSNAHNQTAIKKSKSKMRIDEIIKNLDIQIKHHSEIRTTFDYFIKESNVVILN
jgi:predicted small metal-binding protein